jgi:formylglycine-generating enzyme required for sulfatase activity
MGRMNKFSQYALGLACIILAACSKATTSATNVPMALIPAGTFQMGSDPDRILAECQRLFFDDECRYDELASDLPIHSVTLVAFYMDIYEVTNASYAECVAAGECSAPEFVFSSTRHSYYDNADYANYPVVWVGWNQADVYCAWRGGRLPTEAEWEYAARGGLDGKLYPWGDEFEGNQANFCDMNCPFDRMHRYIHDDGYADTAPVGSYAPNNYGLHDMAGNVSEWVIQPEDYLAVIAAYPIGSNVDYDVVLRGGGWLSHPLALRVASRGAGVGGGGRSAATGFRCVILAGK